MLLLGHLLLGVALLLRVALLLGVLLVRQLLLRLLLRRLLLLPLLLLLLLPVRVPRERLALLLGLRVGVHRGVPRVVLAALHRVLALPLAAVRHLLLHHRLAGLAGLARLDVLTLAEVAGAALDGGLLLELLLLTEAGLGGVPWLGAVAPTLISHRIP
ncbi:hypothetical protein GCM10009665_30900 [Kitasatospora nipponensis]|uniref:Secreted protein n=1 Tax=Kitasatospora nipponensis TaxID=258049 RepID=A0ABN1WCL1_9ACTN